MAAKCAFNADCLEEALRDRIVCGLGSEVIQRRLLTEEGLDLKRTLVIASLQIISNIIFIHV